MEHKRFNNFYYFLTMIIFAMIFDISFILAARTVTINGISVVGSIFIYPITYFIATLFKERYGLKDTVSMIIYAIVSLILMCFLISITNLLPILNGIDGLGPIFNVNYRLMLASIISFVISQYINIKIYDFLAGYEGFRFLISSVIAITIDSILFTTIANIGLVTPAYFVQLITSKYMFGVVITILYAICFTVLIGSLLKGKKKEQKMLKAEMEKEKEKIKKEIIDAEKNIDKKVSKVKKDVSKKKKEVEKDVSKNIKKALK